MNASRLLPTEHFVLSTPFSRPGGRGVGEGRGFIAEDEVEVERRWRASEVGI